MLPLETIDRRASTGTIHSGSTTAAPVLFEMMVQHTVGLKKKKKKEMSLKATREIMDWFNKDTKSP